VADLRHLPRELLLCLKPQRRLDDRGRQSGINVPLHVAVDNPNPGVVRDEAHNGVAKWWEDPGISANRGFGEGRWIAVVDGLRLGVGIASHTRDKLGCVAVDVRDVRAVVVVIDDDLDELAEASNE
jgi:hypothetical protein